MIQRREILEKILWEGFRALLEWSTGLMCINCSVDVFMNLRKAPSNDGLRVDPVAIWEGAVPTDQQSELQFMMTVTHETYHSLQITSTGYLYALVCRYFKEVQDLLPFPFDEKKYLVTLANPPAFSDELRKLFAEALEEGPGQIRVLDLVESSATLYQYRTHYPDLTPEDFSQLLDKIKLPQEYPEYRRAYDLGMSILGEARAFDEVLVATSIALMFERPHEVYADVLKELGKLSPFEVKRYVETFQHVGGEIAKKGHAPLGSAAEVLEQAGVRNLRPHPIFTEILVKLNENASRVSPFSLLAYPGAMDHTAASDALRVMVFRDAIVLPESLRHLKERDADAYLMLAALVFCATNKKSVGPRFGCIV